MTRLWDKGLPLSERVLRYTAGEDHLLDAGAGTDYFSGALP